MVKYRGEECHLQLNKLELYGFKSFSNKTELNFSPGITAFVGPNGCGKSNVVDAIRWVLGEQNPRALRASKMEDLVYAGSENSEHKNYAEVSIYLDNSDGEIPLEYREVTVTRRYYRSGDSEYFLNRVPCRLKDISDILASTSLGKGTYSIIGQGQVEEVVNSRPEDRRLMFEEAAGIALYKMRKREALKKLGSTRAHLVRIEDIVHELQGQEGDIRESAALAREFLEHKEQADKIELSLWAARYSDLKKRLEKIASRKLELEESKQRSKLRADEVEQELAAATAKMQECEDLISAMEQGRTQLLENKTKLKYQLELAEQRMSDYENLAVHSQQQLSRLRARVEETEGGLGKLQTSISRLEQQVPRYERAGELRGQAAGLVRRLLAAAELYCSKADEHIIQTAMQSTEYDARRDRARESEAELTGQLGSVQEELKEWKRSAEESSSELVVLGENQSAVEGELERLTTKEQNLLAEISHWERDLKSHTEKRKELEKSIASVRQKLEMLALMEQEKQWLNSGARTALKAGNEGRLRGVLGAVADLFMVANQQHSLALETALGGALHYVVCDDEDSCRRAIELLKKTKSGRATFLPVTAAKARNFGARPEKFGQHIMGWADQLVKCPDRLAPVAKMLLGNSIVTANLEIATKLAVETKYRYKIVTLDGEVISRGLFTGGSNSRSGQGLLQRKTQAENQEKELQLLTKRMTELDAEIDRIQGELNNLEADRQTVVEEKLKWEKELFRVQTQVEQIKAQASHVQERIARCNNRIGELEAGIHAARSDLAGIVSKMDTDKAGLAKVQTVKQEFSQVEDRLRELVSQWASRQNSLQLTIYSLENQLENQERQLGQVREQNVKLLEEIASLETEARRNKEQNESLQEKIEETRHALSEVDQGLVSVAASMDGQAGVRTQIKSEIDEASRETFILREEMDNINSSLHEAEVRSARWQTEAEAMGRELGAQFGISPQEGLSNLDTRYTSSELAAKLKKFRSRIEEMGEINLAAIGQHKKLVERLEFLMGQQADLVKAEQDILDLVAELDKTIRELFMETFQSVQDHFASIFKTLFGGGSAYLSLCDQDDLLETGIEIFARPPGKRMQALSLLSGGEKSMTAIALLFALQSVRPSPFCILDEIEAALDDVNILRFSEYLRQLAESMQFILITHRRETMEYSDSLYGITLKDGSSQPISVVLNAETG